MWLRFFVMMLGLLDVAVSFAAACGTGFAISKDHVLTAYHVVEAGKDIQVRFGEMPWMNASIADGNKEDDWCVLKIKDLAPAVVPVDFDSPEQGDKVYTFGYPEPDVMGTDVKFNEGNVSALSGYKGDKRLIQHSVPVTHGNSGGVLVLSDDDKAIGIIVSGLRAEFAQNANYAMSLAYLKSRIEKYVDGKDAVAKRRNNKKATCLVKCETDSGTSVGARTKSEKKSANDTDTETYRKCKGMVAVVEGEDQSAGTGFLCLMGGKKYFVTNKHMANQQGKRLKAMFQDGFALDFAGDSNMEVASNRDLVRFEVSVDRPCLEIAEDIPNVGDLVEFFGNARGGGVVTVSAGKVLAVGQDRIEIDTPIQAGNSGSPLVRVSDCKVIGVTTISYFNRQVDVARDPSMVGTRYDPSVKRTREFAVRFVSVEWKPRKYGQFLKKAGIRTDMLSFTKMLHGLCFDGNRKLVLDYQLPELRFQNCRVLNQELERIARADSTLKQSLDRYDELLIIADRSRERNNRRESLSRVSYQEFENVIKSIKDKTVDCLKVRVKVMESHLARIKSTQVVTEEEREDLVKFADRAIRYYKNENRMRFKGLDLPGIPRNPMPEPTKSR